MQTDSRSLHAFTYLLLLHFRDKLGPLTFNFKGALGPCKSVSLDSLMIENSQDILGVTLFCDSHIYTKTLVHTNVLTKCFFMGKTCHSNKNVMKQKRHVNKLHVCSIMNSSKVKL